MLRMLKLLSGTFVGVAIVLMLIPLAHAITITNATLSAGTVTVSGNKAAKAAPIKWEGTQVTTSTNGGTFLFTTAVVPADCTGTVFDGVSTVDVAIAGCIVAPPPPTTAFPATGQTTCWDSSGNVITCAGTRQDGDIQAGATLSYTSNNDGTITDNNTGLVWEKKTNCSGATHCVTDSYTWANALAYVANLNGATFAGHNDWRLPNVKELQSIVNYQNVNPSVSAEFNDCGNGSCTAASNYWASSSYAGFPAFAWFVNFFAGNVDAFGENNFNFVRAVRGGL
jgi:hypothetical protein